MNGKVYKLDTLRKIALAPVIILGLLSILATGGGGGGSSAPAPTPTPTEPAPTPTPTDVPFQLFPDGYFSEGYTRTWHLSGSDNSGGKWTATATFTTGAQTTFDGQPAIPVESVLTATNPIGLPFTTTGVDYYSTDPASRMYLGMTDPDSGAVFTPVSLSIIPQSATIGTSPVNPIGTYSGSGAASGQTLTGTWQLTNANNGLANLITAYTFTSGANFLSSSTTTLVIDQQGNEYSVTYKLVPDASGLIITLSGS